MEKSKKKKNNINNIPKKKKPPATPIGGEKIQAINKKMLSLVYIQAASCCWCISFFNYTLICHTTFPRWNGGW